MKISKRVLVEVAAILFVLGFAFALQAPGVRTRAYFAFYRTWAQHWPFAAGASFPERFRSIWNRLCRSEFNLNHTSASCSTLLFSLLRTVLESGSWEEPLWRRAASDLPEGGIFVDVDAHIGTHTLRAAKRVGHNGHVLAIEPNPKTLEQLRDNIHASGASVVTVVPVACGDTETTMTLYEAGRLNTGETSLSRENAARAGPMMGAVKVRVRPLDSLVKEVGFSRVDVIKIDVEGAEMLVLRGSQETLLRYHPAVIVELDEKQLNKMGASIEEVTSFLRERGYGTGRPINDTNSEFLRRIGTESQQNQNQTEHSSMLRASFHRSTLVFLP